MSLTSMTTSLGNPVVQNLEKGKNGSNQCFKPNIMMGFLA